MPVPILNIGDKALGPEHFLESHYSNDCTSLPDLPDPNNPDTSGELQDRIWQGIDFRGGWSKGPGGTDLIINGEFQRYVHVGDPPPDNWKPIIQTADGWRMRASEIPDTPEYRNWATGKGYLELPNQGYPNWPDPGPRYISEWPSRDAVPGVEGLDWREGTEEEEAVGQVKLMFPYGGRQARVADFPSRDAIPGVEGTDWFEEGAGGLVRFDKKPLTWRSSMVNTNNLRASFGQGEFEIIAKIAAGSDWNNDGDSTTINMACSSFFTIQQSPVGRGRNGELLNDGTTLMPFTGGDLANELDELESGGFDPKATHHSMHSYTGEIKTDPKTGRKYSELFSTGEHAVLSDDPSVVLTRFKLQVTKDYIYMCTGPVDGDCIVRQRYATTPFFKQVQRTYQLDPSDAAKVIRDGNGYPIQTGEVVRNGQPVPPESMIVICLPISLAFLRRRSIWERQTIMNRGETGYPPLSTENGLKTASMLIRSFRISHLREAQYQRADGSTWQPYLSGVVQPPDPDPVTPPPGGTAIPVARPKREDVTIQSSGLLSAGGVQWFRAIAPEDAADDYFSDKTIAWTVTTPGVQIVSGQGEELLTLRGLSEAVTATGTVELDVT